MVEVVYAGWRGTTEDRETQVTRAALELVDLFDALFPRDNSFVVLSRDHENANGIPTSHEWRVTVERVPPGGRVARPVPASPVNPPTQVGDATTGRRMLELEDDPEDDEA